MLCPWRRGCPGLGGSRTAPTDAALPAQVRLDRLLRALGQRRHDQFGEARVGPTILEIADAEGD